MPENIKILLTQESIRKTFLRHSNWQRVLERQERLRKIREEIL